MSSWCDVFPSFRDGRYTRPLVVPSFVCITKRHRTNAAVCAIKRTRFVLISLESLRVCVSSRAAREVFAGEVLRPPRFCLCVPPRIECCSNLRVWVGRQAWVPRHAPRKPTHLRFSRWLTFVVGVRLKIVGSKMFSPRVEQPKRRESRNCRSNPFRTVRRQKMTTDWAMREFNAADEEDRAGLADQGTARSFYAGKYSTVEGSVFGGWLL